MKKNIIFMAVVAAMGLSSCGAQAPKADLKSDVDTLAYALGISISQNLKMYMDNQLKVDSNRVSDFLRGINDGISEKGKTKGTYMDGLSVGRQLKQSTLDRFSNELFAGDTTKTVSKDNFLSGLFAGLLQKGQVMNLDSARQYLQTKMEAVQARSIEEKYADWKKQNVDFLESNKTKEGVVTTPSGLQYKILVKGNGEIPTDSSKVQVSYRGMLIDSTEFDSSYKRNPPTTTFRANQVIKGWTEALTMMPVGSKWQLYIPQDIAYGARDMGNIKPFSTLIFDVELVGIEKDQPKKK
ncbi:MAG: FKBP-type peptidyl-prolyl cis-trans isomerase [Mediterranea sp.]|jgi:FKBP-type peptidyl-prolyl cis-trans isomerase FklB|nr:FKBP-type peptidyl-prolyl cis-trans isomerase [Mediterranea sp.]